MKLGHKMKKTFVTSCIFLFIFFLFLIPHSFGQEVTGKVRVVTEQANIRLKPDIGSIIIHQVLKGTVLDSLSKEKEWYKISTTTEKEERVTGYVHESLVIEIEPTPLEEIKKEDVKKEEKKEERITEQFVTPIMQESTPPQRPRSKSKVNIALFGGGYYFSGGDLNKGGLGLADFFEDESGISRQGEIKELQLNYLFGGELNIPISRKSYLGLGADYIKGEKKGIIQFPIEPNPNTFTTTPKVEAYALRLSLSYFPVPYFYIKTGIEYYLAKSFYYYQRQEGDSFIEWDGQADGQGVGSQLSLGVVIATDLPISLFLEVSGRYGKISNFEGEHTITESSGYRATEKGKLYVYDVEQGDKTYTLLYISEDIPTDTIVTNIKEATLDLTGVSAKIGIIFRF
jgi:hypothetical protein